jgi:2-dehydro-3-deoxygluconokinase
VGGLLTFGETMASLRAAGPLKLGGDVRLSIAGAETNVAIGLARQGQDVSWVGVVGDDELGQLVLRTLRAEGVHVDGCRVEPAAPTGLMLVEPKLALVSQVSYYRGGSAGSTLSAKDVATGLARQEPRLVHVTGITPALGPGPHAAVHAALDWARTAGAAVCMDVNFRSALWPPERARAVVAPLARAATVVVASDDELALASGLEPAAAEATHIGALLDAGVSEVVITRGSAGATVATPTLTCHRDGISVAAVDTVGAGDAFVAGYLAAWLDGEEIEGRLDRAVATAAFCVSTRGDWEGLPTRSELRLLKVAPGGTLR